MPPAPKTQPKPYNTLLPQVFSRVAAGDEEVPYGRLSERVSQASRAELDSIFKEMNPANKEEGEKFLKEQSTAAHSS